MISDSYYSEYLERQPSKFGVKLLMWWHKRLLTMAGVTPSSGHNRILEIGPGHGWFADVASKGGWIYKFVDISRPVIDAMTLRGYQHSPHSSSELFDVVWASHVLEHAQDPLVARELVESMKRRLHKGGVLVVIAPDYLSWKKNFFDVDATHGYPTTIRNVTQLMRDIGMTVTMTKTHRLGGSNFICRGTGLLSCMFPTKSLDYFLSPKRRKFRDGPLASWKAVFGWRQILVIGLNANSTE